ncbi:unnamed protein product, partial [Cylicocyclus nassatus]
ETEPVDSTTHKNRKTRNFKAFKAETSEHKLSDTVAGKHKATTPEEIDWSMFEDAIPMPDKKQLQNEHALIICTVMSTPEILKELSSNGGSIAAVKLSAEHLKGYSVDACAKPMCSLTTTLSGSLNSSCQMLKDAMSLYNNIPLLFAEAYKWKEVYGSSLNMVIYADKKPKEIEKLFRNIMHEFRQIWESYQQQAKKKEISKPVSSRPLLLAFPKFENRARIQFPNKFSEIASMKTIATLVCLLLILGLSITTFIIGLIKIRRNKVK